MTRRGWGVTAICVPLAVGAALLGYVELAVLGVAGLLTVAWGSLRAAYRPRFEVTRRLASERVTRGEPCTLALVVHRRGVLPSLPLVVEQRIGSISSSARLPALQAGASAEVVLDLPTGTRGHFLLPPPNLISGDALGMARRHEPHASAAALTVLPRLHAAAVPAVGRLLDLDGRTTEFAPSGSAAFQSIREYVRGDDLRLVHWRSTAKAGTLMVRHHVDPPQPGLAIGLDTRKSSWSGDTFEEAVEVAASIAVAVGRLGIGCEIVTAGRRVVVEGEGLVPDHRRSVLDDLAIISEDEAEDLGELPARLLVTARPVLFLGGGRPEALALALGVERWAGASTIATIEPGVDRGRSRRGGLTILRAGSAVGLLRVWNDVALAA